MKIYAALLMFAAAHANAEFVVTGNLTLSGQTGVGTSFPTATMEIRLSSSDAYAMRISSSNGTPLLIVDNAGNAGLGVSTPSARLDVQGSSDNSDLGLYLRAGNSSSTYSSSQIIFADASGKYRHSLRTRAAPGQYSGNDIDFFLWRSTGQPEALGAQHVLALQGAPSASSASVHIQPVGVPAYELVVSDGQTTGGGTVLAASVGPHSSRRLKNILGPIASQEAEAAYEDVKALRHATFRYKRAQATSGPLVRGLIYEDVPASIRAPIGESVSVTERLINMELALGVVYRRIEELEKKIAAAKAARAPKP